MDISKFTEAYSSVFGFSSKDVVSKRFKSVTRIARKPSLENILGLTGTYFGISNIGQNWLSAQFHKDDKEFSLPGNEREIQVLSGLILAELISKENENAILSVSSAQFCEFRTPPECSELVTKTNSELDNFKNGVNKFGLLDKNLSSSLFLDKDLNDLNEKFVNGESNKELGVTLKEIFGRGNLAAEQNSKELLKIISELELRVNMLWEEKEILRWFILGTSRQLNQSFATLSNLQSSFFAASELGALTTSTYIGLVLAPTLLSRIVSNSKSESQDKEFKLFDFMNHIEVDDLEKLELYPIEKYPYVSPISHAIKLATNHELQNWTLDFCNLTGVSPDFKIKTTDFSLQLYKEILLGKNYGD